MLSNLSQLYVRLTRAIHSAAVDLHMHGLRTTIKGAEIRLKRAISGSSKANAVALAAISEAATAANTVTASRAARQNTITAAQAEAAQVGGAL